MSAKSLVSLKVYQSWGGFVEQNKTALAAALGVTKFKTVTAVNLVTYSFVLLWSTIDV